MEKHHGISEIARNPAELMTGSFDGIKVMIFFLQ